MFTIQPVTMFKVPLFTLLMGTVLGFISHPISAVDNKNGVQFFNSMSDEMVTRLNERIRYAQSQTDQQIAEHIYRSEVELLISWLSPKVSNDDLLRKVAAIEVLAE